MTIQPNEQPAIRLGQFFDLIWGDTSSVVYLPTKDGTDKWSKRYFAWPENRSAIVQHVLQNAGSGNDVYFGPAVYKRSVIQKIQRNNTLPREQREPITKEDILGSQVLWCEYDGTAPEEWTPTGDEAGSGQPGPSQPMPEPTLRVQSSGPRNQHVYWKLKEFSTDVEFVERVNRVAAYSTNADTSGWDINQVLRPIETVNYKYETKPTVFVFNETYHEYPASQFSKFEKVKEYISENIDVDNLPDPLQVMGKYTWRTDDLDLLNKSLEDFGGRDRSNALMRVGYFCAELGLSDAEVYSLLLHCDDKWGKFKGRDNRKKRLIEIINRARQKHPHAVTDPSFSGLLGKQVQPEISTPLVYGFKSLVEADIQIDWIIEGLIPAGGLGMIASAPGVGKTQFTMQMAIACALNKPMLNYTPVRPHKVMFVSLEMSLAPLKQFAVTMSGGYTEHEHELLERNMLLFPWAQPINLMQEVSRKSFEALIEEYKPEGIYIDSLQKIYLGDLSKDEIRGVYTYLAHLRQQYGVYIFLIHHDRKAQESNKRPRDLSDIYGSVFVTAEPDSVLHLWRPSPESRSVELRELKVRLKATNPPLVLNRNQHLQFEKMDELPTEEAGHNFGGLRGGADGGSGGAFLGFG